jgi:hypothetical protein
MHHKYEKQGLVVVSVATDPIVFKADLEEKTKTLAKIMDEVKQYVTTRKAPFETLIFDESFELQAAKLHFEAPPVVFVFNRQGKWVNLTPEDPKDEGLKIFNSKVEKKVVEFLNEK